MLLTYELIFESAACYCVYTVNPITIEVSSRVCVGVGFSSWVGVGIKVVAIFAAPVVSSESFFSAKPIIV